MASSLDDVRLAFGNGGLKLEFAKRFLAFYTLKVWRKDRP